MGICIFRGNTMQTFGRFFLINRSQERKDFGLRISSMTGQAGKLDYVYPIACVTAYLRAVEEREWLTLLECILAQCVYGKVILNSGDSITGLYSIPDAMRHERTLLVILRRNGRTGKDVTVYGEFAEMALEGVLEKTVQVQQRCGERSEQGKRSEGRAII